ncbi:hypothetical protein FQU76_33615 [Streptomyces qinzhouensis]|uniref:Uncharacterized protein n=1 Tax=Streptomyces qinzhouensis TaxID=2599401 RepID=A0A5B8ISK8_9ACTN|nr:hypothetical protein FQU76_00125 [Streptomyces qinzhouensis]QDY80639.1 hypothetical protein FQU76_33615 [Streptomyces qinzhouensis]
MSRRTTTTPPNLPQLLRALSPAPADPTAPIRDATAYEILPPRTADGVVDGPRRLAPADEMAARTFAPLVPDMIVGMDNHAQRRTADGTQPAVESDSEEHPGRLRPGTGTLRPVAVAALEIVEARTFGLGGEAARGDDTAPRGAVSGGVRWWVGAKCPGWPAANTSS